VTQVALFSLEFALARMWMSWGIRPQALLGYSLGEYVAACLSGVFSLEDALGLVVTRGQLLDTLPPGGMLAVPLGEPEAARLTNEDISLAAVNGLADSVLSGPENCITKLAADLAARSIEYRSLSVTRAGHSAMLEPILKEFARHVARINFRPPRIPYLSNLTGTWIRAQEATNPEYWVRHLRETVRFSDCLDKMLQDPSLVLLEVGPGNGLVSLSRIHPGYSGQPLLASMKMNSAPAVGSGDGDYEITSILSTLGKLWQEGATVDWEALHKNRPRRKLHLPTYAFQRQSYWIDHDGSGTQPPGAMASEAQSLERFHACTWKRAAPAGRQPVTTNESESHWLILIDENGIGRAIGKCLRQAGHSVTFVRASDTFSRISDDEFTISRNSRRDADHLLDAVSVLPDHVVHCWNMCAASGLGEQPNESFGNFREAQELGLLSILSLASALETRIATSVKFTVISNGVHSVIGTEHLSPEKATALGPVYASQDGKSRIIFRNLDIDAEANTATAEELVHELLLPTPSKVIAYRGRHCWIPSREPATSRALIQRSLPSHGIYLVVGHLTGFALQISEYLARTCLATIVVVEPLEWPDHTQWATIAADCQASNGLQLRIQHALSIEQAGGRVVSFQADLACEARLREIVDDVREQFGSLNGAIFLPAAATAPSLPPIEALWLASRECSAFTAALNTAELNFCVVLAAATQDQQDQDINRVLSHSFNSMLNIMVEQGWCVGGKHVLLAEMEKAQRTFQLNRNSLDGVIERLLSDFSRGHIVISPVDIESPGSREPAKAAIRSTGRRHITPANGSNHTYSKRAASPPSNESEVALVRIWTELLGIHDIGVHDNFFDLGGNSLIAMHLMTRIRRDFGRQLPVSVLFQHGTIERLAMRLRYPENAPDISPLVLIRACDQGIPIFCVHALGGDVLCFEPIARHMGKERPFYALQAPGLLDLTGTDDFPTIEARARHYLGFVREVQPVGPYYFSGYCFGGAVAL